MDVVRGSLLLDWSFPRKSTCFVAPMLYLRLVTQIFVLLPIFRAGFSDGRIPVIPSWKPKVYYSEIYAHRYSTCYGKRVNLQGLKPFLTLLSSSKGSITEEVARVNGSSGEGYWDEI